MQLSEAGLDAVRKKMRGLGDAIPSARLLASTYLEAAGFEVEHETKAAAGGKGGRPKKTGRTRLVGEWEESDGR